MKTSENKLTNLSQQMVAAIDAEKGIYSDQQMTHTPALWEFIIIPAGVEDMEYKVVSRSFELLCDRKCIWYAFEPNQGIRRMPLQWSQHFSDCQAHYLFFSNADTDNAVLVAIKNYRKTLDATKLNHTQHEPAARLQNPAQGTLPAVGSQPVQLWGWLTYRYRGYIIQSSYTNAGTVYVGTGPLVGLSGLELDPGDMLHLHHYLPSDLYFSGTQNDIVKLMGLTGVLERVKGGSFSGEPEWESEPQPQV